MLGPTALGFAFYTFIILMKNLFDFAGMIIKRSLRQGARAVRPTTQFTGP
jgi:hypothetical protein